MKRLLLALFFVAGTALGQADSFAHHATARAGHANGLPAANFVGPYSGTPVLGDFIYFNGTNWVSLNKPADGTYSVTFTAGVPSWSAGGGGAPTNATYILETANGTLTNSFALGSLGTGLIINTTTTGVPTIMSAQTCTNQFVRSYSASGQATCSSILTADITAANVTYAKIQNESAYTVLGNVTSSAAAPAEFSGSSMCAYAPSTCAGAYEEFGQRYITGALVTAHGAASSVGTGTSAGAQAPSVAADGNHPGIAECTTGTTTTGACGFIMGGYPLNSSNDSLVIAGGEHFEGVFDVPTVSGATNTYKVWFGFCDIVTGTECTDGLAIYWDNNTDTHWGCETASNATRTTTISTNVASVGWHRYTIDVNAGATSVSYKVDGTALSCSPLTTNIPTGNTRGTSVMGKMVASAGCASASTCVFDVDYMTWFKTGISR